MSTLRPTNRAMVSSGPSNQLRYPWVPLSLVSVRGSRSSMRMTLGTRCRTASWYAAAAPAMPAPQITTSALAIRLRLRIAAIGVRPRPDQYHATLGVAAGVLDRHLSGRVHLDRLEESGPELEVDRRSGVDGESI